MTVEIKELVIRAVADGNYKKQGGAGGTGETPCYDKEEIVEACVKEVLRVLKKRRER